MSSTKEKVGTNSVVNPNLPNQITSARLVISIFVFILIPLQQYWAACVCFSVAAGTDWLDGFIARKYQLVTQLGRILDPFADKILICGVFISLAAEQGSRIMGWMAVVVVGRELLVTALRSFLEQQGADFSANMAGKLKMVFQCAAAIASLVLLATTKSVAATTVVSPAARAESSNWLTATVTILAWLAVASTVYSGMEYVKIAAKLLKDKKPAQSPEHAQ